MDCCGALIGFVFASISPALQARLRDLCDKVLDCLINRGGDIASATDARLENNPHTIVGTENSLPEILELLENDNTRIFGIYGMGGIGKTTLLEKIHDEYVNLHRFDLVIFIDLSREITVDSIQEKIAERLSDSAFNNKDLNPPQDPEVKRGVIFNKLRKNKFLLLLDDLQEKPDFKAIGVPLICRSSKKESRIVFTTRSYQLCNEVANCTYQVRRLSERSSWDLFCGFLTNEARSALMGFESTAKEVAKECGGLPLALMVVGRAMAHSTQQGEWDEALAMLRVNLRSTIPGLRTRLDGEVIKRLKFSYDKLPGDCHKKCFLYCSLFPQGSSIEIDSLTEYLVGEGFLENESNRRSIDRARNSCLPVISNLRAACLLEDGNRRGRNVKLHNMVRQMALWITSGRCESEEVQGLFVVNAGENLLRLPQDYNCEGANKISLMVNKIEELHWQSWSKSLETLLVNKNETLWWINFQYMPKLTVLDLSHTQLRYLPPEIGSLVHLRLLDLSSTKLHSVPTRIRNLRNLRQLRLNDTLSLRIFPRGAISRLSSLQSLTTFGGSYEWKLAQKDNVDFFEERQICLQDLSKFESLKEFGLTIERMSLEDLRALIDSQELSPRIRLLALKNLERFPPSYFPKLLEAAKDLRELKISNCSHPKQLDVFTDQLTKLQRLTLEELPLKTISPEGSSFKNLEYLYVWRCNELEDISWIRQLPCLRNLRLNGCKKMAKIIAVETVAIPGTFFPNLVSIKLEEMRNLTSIFWKPLLLPNLEEILVLNCPDLKKLPFGLPCGSKNLKTIQGVLGWWKELQWAEEDIKSWYSRYFVPVEVTGEDLLRAANRYRQN